MVHAQTGVGREKATPVPRLIEAIPCRHAGKPATDRPSGGRQPPLLTSCAGWRVGSLAKRSETAEAECGSSRSLGYNGALVLKWTFDPIACASERGDEGTGQPGIRGRMRTR